MHIKLIGYSVPRVHLPRIVIGADGERDGYGHGDIMKSIHDREKDYPHTWREHIGKPGGMIEIVEMEYKELMDQKSGGTHHGIKKELTDLAAACICALKEMK